jgi:predicted  nucleic acid-binding Zn-ribbon protein
MSYARKDLISLKNEPLESRIQIYNELKKNRSYYENNCIKDLSFNEKNLILGFFDLALIRVASSLKDCNDSIAARIAKDFTDDEYTAFLKLDKFLLLDYIKDTEIATALFNKTGKIYDVIKKWYDEEMYEYEKLLEPGEYKIRQTLGVALRHEYINRFEKIKRGIIEYFSKDPGAPRQLFNEYEYVIRKQYEAEIERRKIEENMRKIAEEKIDELEKEIEKLREEKEKIDKYLDNYGVKGVTLEDKIKNMIIFLEGKVKELIEQKKILESQKAELENYVIKLKNESKTVIESEIRRYEDTIRELTEKIQNYQNAVSKLQIENLELQEKINEYKNISESSIAISNTEARIMEVNFIGRFETKMNTVPRKFFDPIRKGEINIDKPSDYIIERSDETNSLNINPKELHLYPHNTEVTYIIRKRRLLKDDLSIIIKAKFLSHIENYVKKLADDKTISLADILEYLDKSIDAARQGKVLHVIGIASPTGFDKKVKEYIASDDFKKNFTDYYLSVCLIDLLSGELIYNKLDNRINSYIDIFEPELETEKIFKAKDIIKRELMKSGYVTLSSVVQNYNLTELIAKKAFYELQKENIGKIYNVKGEIVLKRD